MATTREACDVKHIFTEIQKNLDKSDVDQLYVDFSLKLPDQHMLLFVFFHINYAQKKNLNIYILKLEIKSILLYFYEFPSFKYNYYGEFRAFQGLWQLLSEAWNMGKKLFIAMLCSWKIY